MKASGKRVQLSRWLHVKEIIHKYGTINKWELMEEAGLSRSVYEKEAPYWLHKFSAFVEYDRKSGNWTWAVEDQTITAEVSTEEKELVH